MTSRATVTFHPVGTVEDGTIRIREPWTRGLAGIEGFSHLIILYWLDRARKPVLKIHPKNDHRIPSVGFWATRTPHRPNPVGVAVVKLLKRRGGRLWVAGLDAWDGTPVLDIKPYTPKDKVGRLRIPSWVSHLDRAEKDPLRRYAC